MTKTMRIITLLLLTMVGTGQVWALRGNYYINTGTISGGSIAFYSDAACSSQITNATPDATVYIKATAEPGYTAVGVTFNVKKSITSDAMQAPRRTPDIASDVTVSDVDGKPGIYSFTMPDVHQVTVSATFPAPQQVLVSYVDERYTTHTDVSAYVLDETMLILPIGIYVVPNGLTLDHGIASNGGAGDGIVTIIIPDGKTLAIGSTDSPVSGNAFGMGPCLSFYGQTNATGKLVINANNMGINIGGSIVVAHLDVDVTSENSGIAAGGYNVSGSIYAGHQTKGNTLKVRSGDNTNNNSSGISGGGNSVTIKNYDVDIVNEGDHYGITAGSDKPVTIEGIATGDKVNTVIVRSNDGGILSGGNSVTISNCNVEITGTTKTNNVYDACSSHGINATGGVTITGRNDANNTLKIRSSSSTNDYGIFGGNNPITIKNYDVDIVSKNSYGIYTGNDVTITGGQVEVTGGNDDKGIYSGNGNITLKWTKPTDYIKASSYFVSGSKAIEFNDKRFVAYNMANDNDISATAIVTSTINGTDETFIANLAGKTLKPLLGYYVKVDNPYVSIVENNTAKAADFTISDIPYYRYSKGSTVTLANSLDNDDCTYQVNGTALTSNTFTVVTDATVTAEWTITVTLSSTSATYDGTDQKPTVTVAVAGNVINSDAYTVSYKLGDDEVTECKNSGTYTVTVKGKADGYNLRETEVTFTIVVKPVTVTGITAINRAYDGSIYVTLNAANASIIGKVGDEVVTVDISTASGIMADANVGTGKAVTVTGVMLGGTNANNYVLSAQPTDVTVDITAKIVVDHVNGTTITQDESGYSVNLDEGTGSGNPLPDDADLSNLTYSRTLTTPGSGEGDVTIGTTPAMLYTVCLPFEPQTGSTVKYYTLDGVNGTALHFAEVTTTPVANTPYVVAVFGNANFTESCDNMDVTSMAINSKTVDGYKFTGTFTGMSNAAAVDKYILQSGNKWRKVGSGSIYIPPFRAYIEGPTNAPALLDGSIENGATGINSLRLVDRDGTEHWYDLNGRRISKPAVPGIYIQRGHKVVIK